MGDAMGTPGFTTDKGRYQTGKLPARCERFMTDTEQHSETQFASAGQHRVAYRISGAGSCDVLINPGLQSRINLIRSEPGHVNFRHGLESFSRCISFDGLGTGTSDRPPMNNRSAVEDWIDSCGAVLDAVGSTAPVIIGAFGSGPLVLQFVRRYPQRCSGLVFINTYACWVSRSDYPEGTPPEEIANSRESINKAWGRSGLPAPAAASQAGNEAFLQWNAAPARRCDPKRRGGRPERSRRARSARCVAGYQNPDAGHGAYRADAGSFRSNAVHGDACFACTIH